MYEKQKGLRLFLFVILFLTWSCDKESLDPYCQISFKYKTDKFFKGCTIPIVIQAGEREEGKAYVRLYINNHDLGQIHTSPYIYYWNTENESVGEHRLKAEYITNNNESIISEKVINLIPVVNQCPAIISDFDGNTYPVVQIGNQCWMKTNLKTTHYSDGEPLINDIDSLQQILDNSFGVWPMYLKGWYFIYDNTSSNENIYGHLYNWFTVMNGNYSTNDESKPIKGICPDGWHVPSKSEWEQLINFVGGSRIAANMLKDSSSTYWESVQMQTYNSSGFTALPGGCFIPNGNYLGIQRESYFWTATETGDIDNHAYHIYMNHHDEKAFILGQQDSKQFGYSVRCVRD